MLLPICLTLRIDDLHLTVLVLDWLRLHTTMDYWRVPVALGHPFFLLSLLYTIISLQSGHHHS
jgi:hypothetical protein